MARTVVIISIEGHWNHEGVVASKARGHSPTCLPNSVGNPPLMHARLGTHMKGRSGQAETDGSGVPRARCPRAPTYLAELATHSGDGHHAIVCLSDIESSRGRN